MQSPDIRICFVGDSFVNGTADPAYLGWTGRVCLLARKAGHDITYYNLGVRRDTSADIFARWHDECSRRLPAPYDGRVVFSFGTNDMTVENGTCRVSVDQSLDHTQAILARSKSVFPTLMVGPPPVADPNHNQRLKRLTEQFRRVAHTVGVPYLDVFSVLERSERWMQEVAQYDGAHPQAGGYAELAALVQTWPAWWFVNTASSVSQ